MLINPVSLAPINRKDIIEQKHKNVRFANPRLDSNT